FPRRHFAAVDGKVVLPEVDDHLVQLTLTHLRANDLAGEEVLVDGKARERQPDHAELSTGRGISYEGRHRDQAVSPRRFSVEITDLSRGPIPGDEWRQRQGHGAVRNRLGVKLLIDPPVDADRAHPFDVAGTSAERETGDHVGDALRFRQFAAAMRRTQPSQWRAASERR